MTTPKQNLMAVLSGETPEWMPVCMRIANANNLPGHLPQALLEEPLDRLQISEFVGGDILYEISAIRVKASEGVKTTTERRGHGSYSKVNDEKVLLGGTQSRLNTFAGIGRRLRQSDCGGIPR